MVLSMCCLQRVATGCCGVLLLLLSSQQALAQPQRPFTVVIDPGHDPKNRGATSARGVSEVAFNDRLAERLRHWLSQNSAFLPLVTRSPSQTLDIRTRAKRINKLRPDLVISIHHDAVQEHFLQEWTFNNRKNRYCDQFSGYSLLVPTKNFFSELSHFAASDIGDLFAADGRQFTTYHAQPIAGESVPWVDSTRGIYAGDYLYLMRQVAAPIVLVELGFLVNRDSELRLADPAHVERSAHLIAQGVERYYARVHMDSWQREPRAPRVNDVGIQYPKQLPSAPPLVWHQIAQGLQFAMVPIYFRGAFVDRMVLLRADSQKMQLGVFHDASEYKNIVQWQQQLGATVVFNSSFYDPDGQPQTPILTLGEKRGPQTYTSRHGAFVAEPKNHRDRRFKMLSFDGATVELSRYGYLEGVTSYPTLLDFSGRVRAVPNPTWRADRTFIAVDVSGSVVVGTTEGGFFSLHRLGHFLKAYPGLHLSYALNLDGGPPACMAIRTEDFSYTAWGRWESNNSSGREFFYWGPQEYAWEMPAVIALFPRE